MAETSFKDISADDPYRTEYEQAWRMLHTSEWRTGLKALEDLAHKGSLMSMLLVADAMREGWLYNQDLDGAEAWYAVAEKSGAVRGTFGLGLTNLRKKNYGRAVASLQRAAEVGYAPAFNALAGIHFRGDGTPKDKSKAKILWQEGRRLGSIPARINLARMALKGHYGVIGVIRGLFDLLPAALARVSALNNDPTGDGLR